MIYNNGLEAIGHTPLLRLNRITEENCAQILVKFEGVNIGGSVKTRTAWNMIRQAQLDGLINDNTIICEPTSGNQGIGLALVGAVLGLRVIIVMPDSVSEERAKLIRQYGGETVLIHDKGNISEAIHGCLARAQEIAAADPNVFIPQQFENPANPAIHESATGREIIEDVDGLTIDGFCSGIGTGGTLSGIGHALRKVNPDTQIWALEPDQAAILSGATTFGSHMQMGIGDGLIPQNLDTSIYHRILTVSDSEAIEMARRLAREEGLLCGVSSGTNVVGALTMARELGPGKTVVTLLPDTGERYFSTPLFENMQM
jgi:cysteine synthase A